METKKCTKCGTVKSLDSYDKIYKNKMNRKSACKSCRRNYVRNKQLEKSEECLEKQRKRASINYHKRMQNKTPRKCKKCGNEVGKRLHYCGPCGNEIKIKIKKKSDAKYSKANREKINKRTNEWVRENKKERLLKDRQYREKNRDRLRIKYSAWLEKNKKKSLEYKKKWLRDKIKSCSDGYMIYLLARDGFEKGNIPIDLIEIKRLQVKTKRKIKELKQR